MKPRKVDQSTTTLKNYNKSHIFKTKIKFMAPKMIGKIQKSYWLGINQEKTTLKEQFSGKIDGKTNVLGKSDTNLTWHCKLCREQTTNLLYNQKAILKLPKISFLHTKPIYHL
jgi:hypothetical protein